MPPILTRSLDHAVHTIVGWIARRNATQIILFCVAYLVVLGVVDAQLYESVSFSVFYVVPVALAAWYAGKRSGMVMTGFASAVMLASNLYFSGKRIALVILIWNAMMNGVMFSVVAMLLDYLRRVLVQEKILATRDSLTGLCNRRGFFERLDDEAQRARRYARPFSLMVVDVDDFKAVNDFGGHARGDKLLQTVASAMISVVRTSDLAARIGGDEFAVLFPETGRDAVNVAVQRLRAAMGAAVAQAGTIVTFSIGVASFPEDGSGADDLINRADLLMYQAKKSGKNRIAYSEPAL